MPQTYFGRLNRIITFDSTPLDRKVGNRYLCSESRPFILLDVEPCKVSRDRYGFYYYSTFDTTAVIDASTACAVVGRIPEDRTWVFVQREGAVEHAEYRDPSYDDVETSIND